MVSFIVLEPCTCNLRCTLLDIWSYACRVDLQWWGGVFAATFAVVILAALNITGTGIHRSILFTLKRGDLFPRLLTIGRIIAGIYACISAMCFLGLSISGTSIFESLCLSLTSVSTGGLTPRSDVLAQYVSPFGAAIMALSCVLGAISIAVLWDVFRLRSWMSIRRLFTNVEQRGLFVICCIMIVVGVFYTGPLHLSTVAYEAFFFVSSAGFDYHVIGVEMLPPAVLIFVALIGGAALSTSIACSTGKVSWTYHPRPRLSFNLDVFLWLYITLGIGNLSTECHRG